MHDFLPNLRHLRAFSETERLQSITQSASAVFLSQSAVTQAIAKLEALWGVALFERIGTGIKPTEAAKTYAGRVRRALAMMESGISEAIRTAGGSTPRPGKDVLPLLTMTQLRAFASVGETGSFTLAAKLLKTSQPSVHRSTRELESIVSVMLFEKTTRGIVLTRAGQALWQQVKLAFAELAQGYAEIKACAGVTVGRIVVGCMPLARHFVMPETIARFSNQHPEIEIAVIESPYQELLHGLRHGEIDVLVGALRNPAPVNDVRQEALFRAALCVAARHGHPLTTKTAVSVAELADYPWVLPPRGTPTRDHFEQLFRDFPGRAQQGLVESSSQILIRGLLKNSDRLTLISRQQIQFEIDVGELAAVNFEMGNTLREIGLTSRSDWHPTANQSEFLDLLRQVAERHTES